jgi:hypothetical protein
MTEDRHDAEFPVRTRLAGAITAAAILTLAAELTYGVLSWLF